jgi:arginine/ornithine N-succinyltransferase beta subunit
MASSPKAKSSPAFQQLTETLGSKPSKGLAELPAEDLQHLNEQIMTAQAQHQETLEQAEQSIINSAPRPLRGTVRKVLGA